MARWPPGARSCVRSSERKSVFTNFEYDISSRTTAYVQANYARTDALNRNTYTTGDYCVRFDQPGGAVPGRRRANAGDCHRTTARALRRFGDDTPRNWTGGPHNPTHAQYCLRPRSTVWSNANFRIWLGSVGGPTPTSVRRLLRAPYWVCRRRQRTAYAGCIRRHARPLRPRLHLCERDPSQRWHFTSRTTPPAMAR